MGAPRQPLTRYSANVDARELEETLCRLPSVDAVRVVLDGSRVTEVHVLSPPNKPAKQVVRDIQSLAMAKFGSSIDRRAVSVVQIATGTEELREGGDRPRIIKIDEIPGDSRTTVEVTLGWHGDDYVGSSVGPTGPSARLRLIGEAALRALGEVLGGDPPMALDSIVELSVGNRNALVAIVVATDGTSEEVLVGTSLSKNDEAEAGVRAVLDALNRRMPQLLR